MVRATPMRVRFNPIDSEKATGTTSSASWSNPDVKKAMEMLFGIRDNERIWQLEVTEEGLTARIKTEFESVTDRTSV